MTQSWRRDIVVIGGSAGALGALRELLNLLPLELPATIFITLHIPYEYPSILPELLTRNGRIVQHPSENQEFRPGQVFVAPPDHHLIIDRSRVRLGRGPRENRHRPAIDVMFRSAARSHGPRVAGVVLSGQMDDGSAGLMAVKAAGGLAIVQDPNEALAPEMPSRAIQYAQPQCILPIERIAQKVRSLSSEELPLPVKPKNARPESVGSRKMEFEEALRVPSGFACPECHGVLWEIDEGKMERYRCRVGHAYTADSLRAALSETAEATLWAALRVRS